MIDETKQDQGKAKAIEDSEARSFLLGQAIKAAKETQAIYQARIAQIDNAELERYREWLRNSALELMTSEAIPMADLGPIDWAGVSVKTADAIWQETLHRARLNEVGE